MTDTTSPAPPSGAVTPPQRELNLTWALVLISIAQLMVVLDATIANIALPYIQIDLAISNANLPWIVTAYLLHEPFDRARLVGFAFVSSACSAPWSTTTAVAAGAPACDLVPPPCPPTRPAARPARPDRGCP